MFKSSYQGFYEVILCIPAGSVATYGQIADLAGRPRQARQVGYALAALRDETVPWHRVVNARGEISPRASGHEDFQRILLEDEGIEFSPEGQISLSRYGWAPARI
jgi:methylated-DNA-protein-cysteine methyltransferase-like protein